MLPLTTRETIVDLNQLYFDHQLLLMEASQATSVGVRHEHEVGASHIAGRIDCLQSAMGAAAAPIWEALAQADGGSLRHCQGYIS